jgi:F-type H+-transporting ATPase subunit gamma
MIHFYYESQAAEQAARMMAMENASSNAEDLISELTLVMNKIRQASITKELLEIMTAVEALK